MSFWDLFSNLFKKSGQERPSPQDWLPQDSLLYYETSGKLEINLAKLNVLLDKPPRVWTPGIPKTKLKSMDPVYDFGHNTVYIAGADEADHQRLIDFLTVGDVAVYRFPSDASEKATAFVTHRIIEIGKDNKGKYFRFKGDNNTSRDFYLVREENIKWVSVGVIY